MSGSIYGKSFTVSTWGESHGEALGAVIDGCPAGIFLSEEDIQADMNRRRPGSNAFGTKRNEGDKIKILSGVFNGKTTGTPISVIAFNENQKSGDYSKLADIYRPGHADYTFDKKYGFRDYRGGGRSSGRETLARVAAGAIAKKILLSVGVSVRAYTVAIGGIEIDRDHSSLSEISNNALYMPDAQAAERAAEFLTECIKNEDSAGGVIEALIEGLPAGIGEPVFDKADAEIGKALFSIGAVKGVEFGSGFSAASSRGSSNNDFFEKDEEGRIKKLTNNAGGVLGGITDGSPLIVRAAIKPTPSIHKTQKTVDINGRNIDINISGRHDPIIVPRAVVVVEAMAAIALADLLIRNMGSKISNIQRFYNN